MIPIVAGLVTGIVIFSQGYDFRDQEFYILTVIGGFNFLMGFISEAVRNT